MLLWHDFVLEAVFMYKTRLTLKNTNPFFFISLDYTLVKVEFCSNVETFFHFLAWKQRQHNTGNNADIHESDNNALHQNHKHRKYESSDTLLQVWYRESQHREFETLVVTNFTTNRNTYCFSHTVYNISRSILWILMVLHIFVRHSTPFLTANYRIVFIINSKSANIQNTLLDNDV
jgi:hypothetical protein